MFSFLWRWLGLQCVLGERLNTSGGWTVIIFFSMVECPTFSLAWLALSRQAVYRPTDRRLERARRRLVSALVSGVQHVRYLGDFGTITPEQAFDPHAVVLTYRNFGDITLYGLDLSLGYYPNHIWILTGSYSFVDDDLFENLGGIADVALNAPKHKLKVGGQYRFPEWNLRLGAKLRYNGSFPMHSGVFLGDIDSYTVADVSLVYGLPFVDEDLSLLVNVNDVLDNKYRSFVGAPEIGRLSYVRPGVRF